jgi:hypothetical protein
MRYRVIATIEILVDVERDGEKAAKRLVKRHVLNDWILKEIEGVTAEAMHYVIKGLSGKIENVKPFEGGNKEVEVNREEAEECPLY